MEKIVINKLNSLRKRYKLRKTGKNNLSWETTIPKEVIQREANKTGVKTSEFQKHFEAEWLFDNFDGIHLIFVPKQIPKKPNKIANTPSNKNLEAKHNAS